ncbi:MAG: OB-fold nucleic acid binding domain-containing protein, partial [Acidobacteriota bacterium]
NLWRAQLFSAIDMSLSRAQKSWNDKNRGQVDLFGGSENVFSGEEQELPLVDAWTQLKLSQEEKSAVGFYLSNHPLDEHSEVLHEIGIKNIAEYDAIIPGERITVAGIVSGFQVKQSKKGNRFCIFKLEDQSNSVKCLGWSEAYTKYANYLKEDELLVVTGKVESADGQEITLIMEEVNLLVDVVPMRAKKLSIDICENKAEEKILEEIFALLSKNQGKCDVYFNLSLEKNLSVNILSQPLRIQGNKQLERTLIEKGCQVSWYFN